MHSAVKIPICLRYSRLKVAQEGRRLPQRKRKEIYKNMYVYVCILSYRFGTPDTHITLKANKKHNLR